MPRPLSFKIVPGGYVYRAPSLWLFSQPRHYLVSEAKKREIEALFPQPAHSMRRFWIWIIGAVIGLAALFIAAASVFPDYRFTASVALILAIMTIAVIGLHLSMKAKLHRLQPILAHAELTDQKISLDETAQRLGKPQTFEQMKRSGVVQGTMALGFAGTVAITLLIGQQSGNIFSDPVSSMFALYVLIMGMTSAASFRAAHLKKKEMQGAQTPAEEKIALYLKHLTTACAFSAAGFICIFVLSGIRDEFSDMAQARRHVAKGEHASAISSLSKVIAADPQNRAAYMGRAASFNARNEHAAAIADYTKAIELAPGNAQTYRDRAAVHRSAGANEKAIADYTKAIEIEPADRYVHVSRGRVYEAAGDLDRAMADANSAVDVAPTYDGAYHFRAGLYAAKKDNESAIADYTKAIGINPKAIYSYVSRAMVYQATKDYDRAIADSSKAIELNPGYDTPYIVRGGVRQYTREYALAIGDYTKAIEINPKNMSPYTSRASLYLVTGARDLAIADYKKILDLPAVTVRDRQEHETARKAIEQLSGAAGASQVTAPPVPTK